MPPAWPEGQHVKEVEEGFKPVQRSWSRAYSADRPERI